MQPPLAGARALARQKPSGWWVGRMPAAPEAVATGSRHPLFPPSVPTVRGSLAAAPDPASDAAEALAVRRAVPRR